jgi:hypothetical protein
VNLYLTGQALAIESRADEALGKLDGPPAFYLLETVLLDDICHLLLLLLTLGDLLLQLGDLFLERIETVAVGRAVANGTDKGRVGVFEGLRET